MHNNQFSKPKEKIPTHQFPIWVSISHTFSPFLFLCFFVYLIFIATLVVTSFLHSQLQIFLFKNTITQQTKNNSNVINLIPNFSYNFNYINQCPFHYAVDKSLDRCNFHHHHGDHKSHSKDYADGTQFLVGEATAAGGDGHRTDVGESSPWFPPPPLPLRHFLPLPKPRRTSLLRPFRARPLDALFPFFSTSWRHCHGS